jgi:hypothetical protein
VLADCVEPLASGDWLSAVKSQATRPGFELVAAGMMIMAGGHDGKPMNLPELERCTRLGYEAGDEIAEGRTVKSAWTLCSDPWRGGRGSNPDLMLGTCSTIELQPQ